MRTAHFLQNSNVAGGEHADERATLHLLVGHTQGLLGDPLV